MAVKKLNVFRYSWIGIEFSCLVIVLRIQITFKIIKNNIIYVGVSIVSWCNLMPLVDNNGRLMPKVLTNGSKHLLR